MYLLFGLGTARLRHLPCRIVHVIALVHTQRFLLRHVLHPGIRVFHAHALDGVVGSLHGEQRVLHRRVLVAEGVFVSLVGSKSEQADKLVGVLVRAFNLFLLEEIERVLIDGHAAARLVVQPEMVVHVVVHRRRTHLVRLHGGSVVDLRRHARQLGMIGFAVEPQRIFRGGRPVGEYHGESFRLVKPPAEVPAEVVHGGRSLPLHGDVVDAPVPLRMSVPERMQVALCLVFLAQAVVGNLRASQHLDGHHIGQRLGLVVVDAERIINHAVQQLVCLRLVYRVRERRHIVLQRVLCAESLVIDTHVVQVQVCRVRTENQVGIRQPAVGCREGELLLAHAVDIDDADIAVVRLVVADDGDTHVDQRVLRYPVGLVGIVGIQVARMKQDPVGEDVDAPEFRIGRSVAYGDDALLVIRGVRHLEGELDGLSGARGVQRLQADVRLGTRRHQQALAPFVVHGPSVRAVHPCHVGPLG